MSRATPHRRGRLLVLATVLLTAVGAALGVPVAGHAAADGPPTPPPYAKLPVGQEVAGPWQLSCADDGGAVVYRGAAWTWNRWSAARSSPR